MTEIKKILKVVADVLNIASDLGIVDVKAHPPFEWNLKACKEDEGEGWCSIQELVKKLREVANGVS